VKLKGRGGDCNPSLWEKAEAFRKSTGWGHSVPEKKGDGAHELGSECGKKRTGQERGEEARQPKGSGSVHLNQPGWSVKSAQGKPETENNWREDKEMRGGVRTDGEVKSGPCLFGG